GLVPLTPQELSEDETISFPPGRHLLFQVLQAFADLRGEEVWVAPSVPPQTVVELEEELTTLDLPTVEAILATQGVGIRQTTREGENVYVVTKALREPTNRKRGRLVRVGEAASDAAGDASAAARTVDGRRVISPAEQGSIEAGRVGQAASIMDEVGAPDLRVFQRVDGARQRYLVQFETDSREVAQDVAEAISAILRSEIEKRQADPNAGRPNADGRRSDSGSIRVVPSE
ncbi:MAG TPA: hypothetical protein VK116_17100, partial [Planctomycetota bacterium]|nr:hypothetical protein [Planctomycetota bacterium]